MHCQGSPNGLCILPVTVQCEPIYKLYDYGIRYQYFFLNAQHSVRFFCLTDTRTQDKTFPSILPLIQDHIQNFVIDIYEQHPNPGDIYA